MMVSTLAHGTFVDSFGPAGQGTGGQAACEQVAAGVAQGALRGCAPHAQVAQARDEAIDLRQFITATWQHAFRKIGLQDLRGQYLHINARPGHQQITTGIEMLTKVNTAIIISTF